jgi:hypothetical protein
VSNTAAKYVARKETTTAGVSTYSTFSHKPVMKPPHGPIEARAKE